MVYYVTQQSLQCVEKDVSPEGLSESVAVMLQMIGEVTVVVKDSMVDIVITLQDYTQYYKGCRKKMSSSVSGLHFGHWKAADSSNEVA